MPPRPAKRVDEMIEKKCRSAFKNILEGVEAMLSIKCSLHILIYLES
jgi:hypothetical protein